DTGQHRGSDPHRDREDQSGENQAHRGTSDPKRVSYTIIKRKGCLTPFFCGTERAEVRLPPCAARRRNPSTRRSPMPVAVSREGPRSLHVAARLVSISIVVAALWVGQVVLIPIALAAIVTFLMSPLVTRQ